LGENCLTIEEIEAIRLKDIEDLDQERCAKEMNVSRTTYTRILESGRKKVAEALIEGKAIRIEGGNYEVAVRRYRCRNDHEWEAGSEGPESLPQACPSCGTSEISMVLPVNQSRKQKKWACRKTGKRNI
jgi:predicted DNA-binding protein (UPF0251 family)